jgi:hypothetical protein
LKTATLEFRQGKNSDHLVFIFATAYICKAT